MENSETEIKIVMVGEMSVGKTCIVDRAINDNYDENSCSTLGTAFSKKEGDIDGKKVLYQIWDTAGQEKYRGMAPMYFRGAHAALCVYSIIDRQSFEAIDEWIAAIHEKAGAELVIFIVANKIDLEQERCVSRDEGVKKANELGVTYHEVSAKSGQGFDSFLYSIGKAYLDKKVSSTQQIQNQVNLQTDDEDEKRQKNQKHSCC